MTDTGQPVTMDGKEVLTLSIDVGGSGLKGSVLDSTGQMLVDRVRIPTPYPCPPEMLVGKLTEIQQALPTAHRASVGFPGLVRDGRVRNVPALSRREYAGPRDEELAGRWEGFDLADGLADAFAMPVKVANDADMQGCAVVTGEGFEFVMTLGTGCGTAAFYNNHLLPHMELSHAPTNHGGDFDAYVGNAVRKRIGTAKWVENVIDAIEIFDNFLFFDRVYVGGGNAKRLRDVDLGPKATIVPNTAGILGGIRIWELS